MTKLAKLDFLLSEHKASFTIDKIEYHSISQWMASAKATLFRDDESCKIIMKTDSPYKCEHIARSIKGYNSTVWGANIRQLLYRGMKAKLLQNTLHYLNFITLGEIDSPLLLKIIKNNFIMAEDHQLASDLLIKLKNEFLMITDDC